MNVPYLAESGVSMTFFLRRALSSTLAGTLTLAVSTIGLLGTVAVLPARALPLEQVAARLASVPVYVLGNENSLLLLSTEENADSASLFVFMSPDRAKAFMESNPEVSEGNQIVAVNLAELYKQSRAQQEQPLRLTFVPEEAEATQAAELSSDYKGGVPLFYAQLADGSPIPSVPAEGGEAEAVIPMFFSSDDLESNLNALGQSNPEARAAISIGVVPLESLIGQLQSQDEELFNRIRLLPDSDIVRSISGS